MKEVEILVKVLAPKEKVLNKLKKFESKGIEKTRDIYFYDPKNDKLQAKNGKYPTEWFRIRTKGNKHYMAYKIDKYEKDKWKYSDEFETEVSDAAVALKIISHLGFEKLVEIENEKHIFLTDKYEIVLEDVKKLGIFLEVERLSISDDEDITKAKKEIWDFIKSLGFKVSEELNLGKPELMLKQDAHN